MLLSRIELEARHQLGKLAHRLRRLDHRRVRLDPDGTPRAAVLFSYILDPLLDPSAEPERSHTHFWESLCMATTLRDLGCSVDAIHWTNHGFTPDRQYDVVLDVRTNLERLVPALPRTALRILHCDTAHYAFQNAAEERRMAALEERRGVRLRLRRQMPVYRSELYADLLTYLGNEFTRNTYRGDRPMERIPVSVPLTYPWPAQKSFDAVRRSFLWFGSGGLVHKGLDLVLEAFAGLPDHRLTVCGPIGRERDFERLYRRELYATPNIDTVGWVDVASERFRRIADSCVGLVYPSCSEGGGASVLTCIHAATIPVLTPEASVDLDDSRGVLLEAPTVAAIRDAVVALSERPASELREMARAGWEWARRRHTRERFAERFRELAERIVSGDFSAAENREDAT